MNRTRLCGPCRAAITGSFSLRTSHYKDKKLCVMHTLLYYIKRVQTKRLSRKVLVSYVTYKEKSMNTVARWLKNVLQLSGISTDTLKAHSYRAASASAAFDRGCCLKTNFSTADWSSDKNFKRSFTIENL